jgi:hypothetical protein
LTVPDERRKSMPILTTLAFHANGAALVALERFMLEQDYSGRCRCDAKAIVRRTGCVADCVPTCLDPEHLAAAEEEYVAALPAVDFNDDAWGDPSSYMTVDDLMDAGRRVPRSAAIFPPTLTDTELLAGWPGGDS